MGPNVPECVILVGRLGAGKTTGYRDRIAATHAHVSKDLWPHAKQREHRQQRVLAELLAAGRSVVVNNTNPRREGRAALIAFARAHGARVIGDYFDVSTRAIAARNQLRTAHNRVTLDDRHAPVVNKL